MDFGFRLPAAIDNRPLTFEEFEGLVGQIIYVSATPADYELARCEGVVVEQLIRPTGLLDPVIEVRPSRNQVDDLMHEISLRSTRNERTLVTTLTKRMAEELTRYLSDNGVKTRYIHSDVDTLERVEIMEQLRRGFLMSWWGSTCSGKGLTCQRSPWWPSSTPTRRDSSARSAP